VEPAITGDLTLVRKYATETEAQIARAMLECEGIRAVVLTDDAGGMLPQFQMVEGVRLMVQQDDLDEAERILEL
jgi:hypothetical protein